jgi:hypothetical protein
MATKVFFVSSWLALRNKYHQDAKTEERSQFLNFEFLAQLMVTSTP